MLIDALEMINKMKENRGLRFAYTDWSDHQFMYMDKEGVIRNELEFRLQLSSFTEKNIIELPTRRLDTPMEWFLDIPVIGDDIVCRGVDCSNCPIGILGEELEIGCAELSREIARVHRIFK